jgi:hypothetical protein
MFDKFDKMGTATPPKSCTENEGWQTITLQDGTKVTVQFPVRT